MGWCDLFSSVMSDLVYSRERLAAYTGVANALRFGSIGTVARGSDGGMPLSMCREV